MRTATILLLFLFLASCSNDRNELYDKAVEVIKERLKAPSTAKFEPYDESLVHIMDSAGVGNPLSETMGPELLAAMADSTRKKIAESDNTVYQAAQVEITYEAQNAFGVPIKGTKKVIFKRWMYPKEPGEWELVSIND